MSPTYPSRDVDSLLEECPAALDMEISYSVSLPKLERTELKVIDSCEGPRRVRSGFAAAVFVISFAILLTVVLRGPAKSSTPGENGMIMSKVVNSGSPIGVAGLSVPNMCGAFHEGQQSDLPHIVWAFWFGAPMDEVRGAAFRNLSTGLGIPVCLVTMQNLANYNRSDSPIHHAFSLLTDVHKADYLRTYFMHHYGGGYHDVKKVFPDAAVQWPAFFEKLRSNSSLWMAGGKGPGIYACVEEYFHVRWCVKGFCCPRILRLKKSWGGFEWRARPEHPLPNVQGFIVRANTPLTQEWLRLLHQKLDKKFAVLQKHPGPPGRCCFVFPNQPLDKSGYPFRWAELLGEITTPVFANATGHIAMGLPLTYPPDYLGYQR